MKDMGRRDFLMRVGMVGAAAALPLSKLVDGRWARMASEVQRFSDGTLRLTRTPESGWVAAVTDRAGKVVAYVDDATRVWWPTINGAFDRGSRLIR